jgi:hypothetical protein
MWTRATGVTLKVAAVVGCLLATVGVQTIEAGPSGATPAGYEQNCENNYGDNCFAYADLMRGAWIGAYQNIPDFASPAAYFDNQCHSGDYVTSGDCTGKGKPLWNDAASDDNLDRTHSVKVWYNQNYSGPSYTLSTPAGGYNVIDLPEQDPTMLNNNRSQNFL